MDAVDITVLRALHAWRKAGHAALLITVVKTWGSSPRPVGAMLALRAGAELVGSVSGGCIEDDLFDRFRDVATTPPTTLVRYGVTAEEANRFGLPCGGTVELMVECNPCVKQLKELLDYLNNGVLVRRTVARKTGNVQLIVVNKHAPLLLDSQQLVMYIGPQWRMLLIGAGVLANYLASIAQSTGFTVTVCDPRPEHTYSWNEHEVPLLRGMPDDAVTDFRPDPSSCVVTLSHDPRLDDLAVIEALNSPAFYVGAIGSRQNNEARRARLIEHFEIDKKTMERLHGPIGLFIDSKTPAEIAVSIMAEIIAIKNGVLLEPAMKISAGKQKKERLERTVIS